MGRFKLPLQPRLATSLCKHSIDWRGEIQYLHDKSAEDVREALKRTTTHIDQILNLIGGRRGLDHDQVFFGRFGVPVLARFLEQCRLNGAGVQR